MNTAALHQKAISLAKTYKQSEAELLSVLISLEQNDGFRRLNYTNLFVYCRKALGLSETQACYFLKVARTADKVPELVEAVKSGEISLSQARRVAAVITPETAALWIEKAASLSGQTVLRTVGACGGETRSKPPG